MNFKYTVYTPQKKILSGMLDVTDRDMAVKTLERSGYNILTLKRTRSTRIEDILPSLFSVKKIDIVLFSRQLAMLLEKGVNFLTALKLATDQVKNRILKKTLVSIGEDVEGGSTFSDAVAKYSDIFPLTYCHLMRVGEKSGNLETVLYEAASHLEQDEIIRKRIRNAFIYPSVIFVMGIGTVVVLVTTVLPSMMNLFDQFSADLPLPTRITVALSDFLSANILYILAGILLIALAIIIYSKSDSGKYAIEKFVMKIPVLGHITFTRNLYQFSRISTILLSAGLPITEVINVAQQSIISQTIRRELDKIPASLMQGQGLSQSMKESSLFPSMLLQMVITGEETNTLEASFGALAEHYEFEFDQSLNSFISLLEPVLVVAIGLIVGFIAVSAMMPIYSIYDVMF